MADQQAPDANLCPHCGKAWPAVAGLCPACLLKQGAAGDTGLAVAFTPPDIADLERLFPQLEMLGLIGAGGMGAVYKARQRELDRIVALKILPPGIGDRPGFAERFTREAKALAKLSHPGIVTIHDTGRVDGLYYLLMEFVDGLNLRQLTEVGRISPREALAIVPQICDALQYAHDAGVVHRDIKPENILLDRQGRVKVADFGLAKLVGSEETTPAPAPAPDAPVTEAGQVMGTPYYMAPEQIEHPAEVDHRADIYSLGVVLYQMLTGELPGQSLEPPSRKVEIDVRLDEVVLRALEKNPEHRYQQASQLKQIVETIVASTNLTQKKESPTMNIIFNCPQCQQKLAVDPSAAGATVNCPGCATPLVVPAAPHPSAPVRASVPVAPVAPAPQRPPSLPAAPTTRARGFAIWSLVLGIIGIVPILGLATGVFGLALGITALVKKTTSQGLGVAGSVLGGIATLMIPLHIAMLVPIFSAAKFGAGTTVCVSNLKTIGVGIVSYQQKHNGMYPESLDVLVREGLIPAKTLRCPLHDGKGGEASYGYSRPAGRQASGIIAWDRAPHAVVGKAAGRNVVYADGSARFITEDQFRSAPRAASKVEERVAKPGPPKASPENRVAKPALPPRPEPPPVEKMTVESVLASLRSTPPREMRPLFKFLEDATPRAERQNEVVAALKPLLNDVDAGDMAFQAFAAWAGKEQVPDLIEAIRVAPTSARSKEAMKVLSRMGDERAVPPLAACLTEFRVARDAKAALATLGGIAKPAILPLYHHEDRNAREAARELLRGYNATDGEIFAESLKALSTSGVESRRSAIQYLSTASLAPGERSAVARALRPLVTDNERGVRDAARGAMKKLATPADADFLLEQLNSTDDGLRDFATELLVQFKDARAAKPLAVLLADSHKTYAVGKALIRLGSTAEPAILPYLRSEDPNTRKRAAEILTEIGTAASLPALQTVAKDANFFAKVAAERAVSTIKSRTGSPGAVKPGAAQPGAVHPGAKRPGSPQSGGLQSGGLR